MYARIPALLGQGMTQTEIAAMYGVKPGTLKVFCSQRGISLRKRGPLPPHTKLVLPDETLPLSDNVVKSLRKRRPLPPHSKLVLADEPLSLSDDVLKSLREAARSMGKGSTARLVSDLLEKIVSDDLYKAVLDEEAMPDRPVTPAPQSDPTSPRPSEQVFVHSPPLSVNDQDSSITASATTTSATKISA
jgi:hypothetical protein